MKKPNPPNKYFLRNHITLRRPIKTALILTVGLLLLCQAFIFTPSPSVMAHRSTQDPNSKNLQAETTEISTGALVDEMIQQNPEAFGVTAASPDAESGTAVPNIGGTVPDPLAPALSVTFDGINFNEDANLNGFFQIPPDPSGAVGASHVVNVVNSAIEWYTKAGVMQNRQTLSSFFASTPVTPPQTLTFDPKVIYDQYAGRFIVTTMERIEASGMIPNQSRVYFAVSDDSDPNGIWHRFALNTEEVINTRQTWADFPGLAVDSEAIYYTNNQFAHNNQTQAGVFQGQRLRIIAKAPFYAGGVAIANTYDPATLASANPAGDGFALATTMQPTQMYGDLPGGVGTYLVAYSGINDFVSGTDANLFVQIIQVDNPLLVPTFTGYFSQWGTIQMNDNLFSGLPGAPQNGTTRRIATNDRRISQHGVYRNGKLYCAAPILEPSSSSEAGQVSAHWFVLDPAVILAGGMTSDPPPTDQGDIGGEDIAAGTYTFFPSVAVDALNNLAIGFAASAPSIFPGSFYTGRLATDPAGTTQPAGTLRAGVDFYIRDFTTSMTVNSRWGDYSGIWLDPADESTFCVYNEHALSRGTVLGGLPEEDGRWGTAWGCFALAGPAPTPTPDIEAGPAIITTESCPPANGAIDPGERVTVNLELHNNGTGATTDLVATLTTGGGVSSPSLPQSYGALAPGGSATRDFSFTASGVCGGTITATWNLNDGPNNLGTVTKTFILGCTTPCGTVRLVVTSTISRINATTVKATYRVKNIGTILADDVTLTNSKLGTTTGGPLPQFIGDLPPDIESPPFDQFFTNSTPGASTTLKLDGTYTGGTFSSTKRVTVP